MSNEPQAVAPEENDSPVILDTYDTEALKKFAETQAAQKSHWREKAKKADEEKSALLEKVKQYESAAKPAEPALTEAKNVLDTDSFIDNLSVLRSFADDEVSELRTEAKNLGIDVFKYAKSKAGQAHIKEYRQGKQSEGATPSPSGKIPVFNGKPITEVLLNGSPAEKQAAYEAKIKGSVRNQNV